MKIEEVQLRPPEGFQLILGQAHFIKSVEDIYEVLATSMPGIKFGVAFCEASGKALVRSDGSDSQSKKIAEEFAERLGAGHSFVVVLDGAFPINVLHRLKNVDEVVGIFCATANVVTAVIGDTGEGRGILGVVDGVSPKGKESDEDRAERHAFLRRIGYKR
ncbi:MAG: adenosine-specific kinase [Thaumarchaeota archaeon]|nr:adenosine-specific kinase [Nitrososphaerota archaeon]